MNTPTKKPISQSQLVRAALKFWFADNDHIRSPFPDYVHVAVQQKAVSRFGEWLDRLSEKAKDDVNDEILAEKFEEFLFEAGLELVDSEDERITLLYPFLPRVGDPVGPAQDATPSYPSKVASRCLTTEGDTKFLHLQLEQEGGPGKWETKIELPG